MSGATAKVKTTNQFILVPRFEKPAEETSFERFVAEKQIPEALWLNSVELREWVKRNADRRYVPEFLLAAFNVRVNDKLSFVNLEVM